MTETTTRSRIQLPTIEITSLDSFKKLLPTGGRVFSAKFSRRSSGGGVPYITVTRSATALSAEDALPMEMTWILYNGPAAFWDHGPTQQAAETAKRVEEQADNFLAELKDLGHEVLDGRIGYPK